MNDITTSLVEYHFSQLCQVRIKISEIKAKVGNVVTNLVLKVNAEERTGIIGI
jgi:hypothetical protein